MRIAKKLAAIGAAALCIHLLICSGIPGRLEQSAIDHIVFRRNAASAAAVSPPASGAVKAAASPAPSAAAGGTVPASAISAAEKAIPTTISGGLKVKNETKYDIDAAALLKAGPSIKLAGGKPQILIIHTHSSEAYAPAGLDKYDNSDSTRTEDKRYNIIRVGDELTEKLTAAGLSVIHDRSIYDYPSYTGSYTRSGEAVQKYLKDNPTIKIVIDLHRDALIAGEEVYKTVAAEDGVCASQIMLLSGTDESGLTNPKWRENLKLALYMQNAVTAKYPTLMRPVEIVPQRYNLHLTTGSLILEVGSSGNTLQEALAAVRLFGDTAGPALAKLIE